jgi:hypothetical protein
LLCAEYSEGAVDSTTGKVYIAVKQIAGPTDIFLCVGVNTVATEQRFLESGRQQLDFELLIKLTFDLKVIRNCLESVIVS